MRVGWLVDELGYIGGAELTMREFAKAAPDGVELVRCPPREIVKGLGRYVIGNCMTYPATALGPRENVIRYHHDLNRADLDRDLSGARHVFCSRLQREKMGMQGELIPPAIDLDVFRRHAGRNHRSGAVCVGRMAYGKGAHLLVEYPEPVDVYSTVPLVSQGNLRYQGPADDVAEILSHYARFIFLPTAIEPFGRSVVEAWAVGLELMVNRNVGSVQWIKENPDALATAATDFWELVLK